MGVYWAVSDQSVERWYPTEEAARAALQSLALSEGRVAREDGMYVDLTAYNYHTSYARVEVLGESSDENT